MSHLLRNVSLSVTGAVLFAASPAFAADWSPAATVASGPSGQPADVSALEFAGDAAGNLTAVWIGSTAGTRGVYSAERPAGGAWGAPAKIVDAPGAERIKLSLSADGHAVLGWNNRTGNSTYVSGIATRTPAGAWTVTEGPNSDAFAELAIDDAGVATALSTDSGGNLVSKTRNADGTWSAPVIVAPRDLDPADQVIDGSVDDSDLAVNSTGDAVATWTRTIGDSSVVQATRKPKGGEWTAPQTLATGTPHEPINFRGTALSDATVGIDSTGQATVAWKEFVAAQPLYTSRVRAVLGGPTGNWAAVSNVSGDLSADTSTWTQGGAVPETRIPEVTVGAGGESVVTWGRLDDGEQAWFAAPRTSGGSWQPPTRLGSWNRGWDPAASAVVDRAGNATVAWVDSDKVLSRSIALRPTAPPASARKVSFSARLMSWNRSCPRTATAYANGRSARVPVLPTNSRTTCTVAGGVPVAAGTKLGSRTLVVVSGGGLFPTIVLGRVVAG